MKTSTKKATATTSRGTTISITATASRGVDMVKEVSFCDGDNVEIEKAQVTNENKLTLEFNGKKFSGYLTTRKPSPSTPDFYGYFISSATLPFDQDVYTTIEACINDAKAEAEADQSWIDYNARKAEAEVANQEYYKHKRAVESMMTLNGKTY